MYLRDKPKTKKPSKKQPSKPTSTVVDEADVFSKPSEETTLDKPCQLFEKLSLDEK